MEGYNTNEIFKYLEEAESVIAKIPGFDKAKGSSGSLDKVPNFRASFYIQAIFL